MDLRKTLVNFIRYGLVGVVVNLLLYILYIVMTYALGVFPLIATSLIYAIGILLSFFANKSWSFENRSANRDVFPRYVLTYFIGYLVQIMVLSTLIYVFEIPHALAQLVAMGSAMVIIFLLLKTWVFPEHQSI